jgi:hypothetical protein
VSSGARPVFDESRRNLPWPPQIVERAPGIAALVAAELDVVMREQERLGYENLITGAMIMAFLRASSRLYELTDLNWTGEVIWDAAFAQKDETATGADVGLILQVSSKGEVIRRKLYLIQAKRVGPGEASHYDNALPGQARNMLGKVDRGGAWVCVYGDNRIRFIPAEQQAQKASVSVEDGVTAVEFLTGALTCRHGDPRVDPTLSVQQVVGALAVPGAAVVTASTD